MKKEILGSLGFENVTELKRAIKKGEEKAVAFVEIFKEIFKTPSNLKTLKGKSELLDYLKTNMAFLHHEAFNVIFLNSENKIVADETLFTGTINRSAIYPRTIIEKCIKYNARGIIFAHNHPSGNLTPSKKDIELTLEMQNILEKMDIQLLDHIIISDSGHFSFYEDNLL